MDAVETQSAQPIDDQRIRGADHVAIARNQIKRNQTEMIGMAMGDDQTIRRGNSLGVDHSRRT